MQTSYFTPRTHRKTCRASPNYFTENINFPTSHHSPFPTPWRWSPTRIMASSFLMRFLDHTQRRTTVGRTPLDEWSARRRDLYLTTHNTHEVHPCPLWDSNPHSQQASGLRPRGHWDRHKGALYLTLKMANNPETPYILRTSKRYWRPETGSTLSRDSFVCGLFYREEGINKDENIWEHSVVLPAMSQLSCYYFLLWCSVSKKRKLLMAAAKEWYPTYRFFDITVLLRLVISF